MSAPEAGNILIHTWKEHSNHPRCPPLGWDPVKDELWTSTEMELRSEYNQGLIVKSRRLAGTCAGGSAQHLLKAGPVTSACSGTCQGLSTSQGISWVLVIPDTSQSLSIAESCLVLWHRRHVLFFPCSQKSQANPQLQTSCSLSALFLQGMQQRYVPILNLIVPQIKKGMIFVARGVWILAIPLPSEPHFWLLAKSVWGSTTALWKKCASTWEVSAQL